MGTFNDRGSLIITFIYLKWVNLSLNKILNSLFKELRKMYLKREKETI